MKKIFNLMMIFSFLLCVTACSTSEDAPVVEMPLEATYSNVAGTWQLTNWNGAPLNEGLYCYMELDRKNQTFVIYDNMDSMYDKKMTGSYKLSKDKNDENVDLISGEYAFGFGTWNNVYQIVVFEERMEWTVQGDATDVSIYERCAEIPEEFTKGSARTVSASELKKFL